jgi:hypothetical protein
MAVPSPAAFLARFPELGQAPEAVVEAALATAGRECSETVWADSHGDGVAFYAAHLLALRTRQIGATVGESVKGPSGNGLEATWYGQQHLELMRSLPITGFVV